MPEIVKSIPRVHIDRDVDRVVEYGQPYWSANKVNFDPKEMPQKATGIYDGSLYVAHVDTEFTHGDLADYFLRERLEFAEVMEAFWFGVHAELCLSDFEDIYVPGTLGSPPNDPGVFCPLLFKFSESRSLGIEHLEYNSSGGLLIPEGKHVLLREIK